MSQYLVQWYVSIDSNYYLVAPRGPGQGWQLLQLQGRRPGVAYDVQLSSDGRTTCSCPDGLDRRLCKHVVALRALGTITTGDDRIIA